MAWLKSAKASFVRTNTFVYYQLRVPSEQSCCQMTDGLVLMDFQTAPLPDFEGCMKVKDRFA
jgi:hypothetical protein